jgi:hypothetical protein
VGTLVIRTEQPPAEETLRPVTVVWIDAREARIVRSGGEEIERLESEVPAHHRSTGHVRHDPLVRHGGGGRAQTAGEPHRLEHLARFLDQVIERLPPEDDLLVLGPGTVRVHLLRRLRLADHGRGMRRRIVSEPAHPVTDRQLLARSRVLAGEPARRVTVGAYRWSAPADPASVGRPRPRRVAEKARVREDR